MVNNNLLALNESFISVELFFCIGLSYLTFEANRLALSRLFTKTKFSALTNLTQIAVNAGITLGLIYLSLVLYFVYFLGYASVSGFDTEVKSFSLFFGITSILYTILGISYKLLHMRNEQLISEEEILKEQAQFELQTYQAEMNPELLFECLESAIQLIDLDIVKAEDYIDDLAFLYRYMLSTRNKEVISIEQEIQITKVLIGLHNVKHKNLITIESALSPEGQIVVPGSVPILVDEIIKNTMITATRPLQIVLGLEGDYLTLSYKMNDRLLKNRHEAMTIKRLQSAYSYLSDQPLVKVQAYGESFYKIPLLNQLAA